MPRLRFSDRYGFTTPRDVFQSEDIDEALSNRIWNIMKNNFVDTLVTRYNSDNNFPDQPRDQKFIIQIYDGFFKDHIDPLTYRRQSIRNDLKKRYFKLTWFEKYNLLEFVSNTYHSTPSDLKMTLDRYAKYVKRENKQRAQFLNSTL